MIVVVSVGAVFEVVGTADLRVGLLVKPLPPLLHETRRGASALSHIIGVPI